MTVQPPTLLDEAAPLIPATDGLLAMVLDRTSDGILLANRDGVIVYANQPLLSLFGYEAIDLIGQRIEVLIPEDLRRSHRSSVDKFAKSPQQRPMGRPDLDIEGRRSDGTLLAVDVQLVPMPEIGLVVATVRDMAEQRRQTAERAIDALDLARVRADNERLAGVLDSVVQRLFALGMSISATADQGGQLPERWGAAVDMIDKVIEDVQDVRKAHGPRPTGTSGP